MLRRSLVVRASSAGSRLSTLAVTHRFLDRVRHAIHYIRNNFRKHEAQRGAALPKHFVDPYSSEGYFAAFVAPVTLWLINKATPLN